MQLTYNDIKKLVSHSEFKEVVEISLSGGELFLNKEVDEITNELINNLPKLKTININHNATMQSRLIEYIYKFSGRIEQLGVFLSLDGKEETHNKSRGIINYHKVIEILKNINNANLKGVQSYISTTINKNNAKKEEIEHVKNIAKEYNAKFTFRIIAEGEYYKNEQQANNLTPSKEQLKDIFTNINLIDDPFFKIQKEYFLFGKNQLIDETGNLNCLAGKKFVTILANKDIVPCIYSTNPIGTVETGITSDKIIAPCPCQPTECVSYPNLIYKK